MTACNVDDATLSSQLTTNLTGVAKLFQASGAPSDPNVQFVSATQDTVPSSSNGYAVQVFTPASQATYTVVKHPNAAIDDGRIADVRRATVRHVGNRFAAARTEYLSFMRARRLPILFRRSMPTRLLARRFPRPLRRRLRAAQLRLTSKQYGSAADFAVVSSASIGTDTSGVGTTPQEVQGVDVVGTINGESATGIGQFLTGSQIAGNYGANGQALGLQLRVTATSPGNYGNVVYTSPAWPTW